MFNTSVLNTYLHEIEWVKLIEPDTENMIIRRFSLHVGLIRQTK